MAGLKVDGPLMRPYLPLPASFFFFCQLPQGAAGKGYILRLSHWPSQQVVESGTTYKRPVRAAQEAPCLKSERGFPTPRPFCAATDGSK